MPTFMCVRKLILAVVICLLAVASLSAGQAALAGPATEPGKTFLHEGWQLQSSCVAKASGEKISTAGFDANSWHKATIPATVVGALVTDKTYADPDYGKNLLSIPGMDFSRCRICPRIVRSVVRGGIARNLPRRRAPRTQ